MPITSRQARAAQNASPPYRFRAGEARAFWMAYPVLTRGQLQVDVVDLNAEVFSHFAIGGDKRISQLP